MRKYGRYTQLHPNTNLRIIALNVMVQDGLNSYLWSNITDRFGELAWLQETLDYAEKNKEAVIIIGHYSPFTPWSIKGIHLPFEY